MTIAKILKRSELENGKLLENKGLKILKEHVFLNFKKEEMKIYNNYIQLMCLQDVPCSGFDEEEEWLYALRGGKDSFYNIIRNLDILKKILSGSNLEFPN